MSKTKPNKITSQQTCQKLNQTRWNLNKKMSKKTKPNKIKYQKISKHRSKQNKISTNMPNN